LKTEYFEYLIAVYDTGSINKSANILRTTPQNVSRVMRQMEKELDVELFKRTIHGVEFTEAGLEAVTMAHEINNRIKFFENKYRTKERNENVFGELNVVATRIQSNSFLNQLIMEFSEQYPAVNLNYYEDDFLYCLQSVVDNANTIGFVPLLEGNNNFIPEKYDDVLEWDILNSDRVTLIVSKNSPWKKYKTVQYPMLKDCKFVIYAKNTFEDGWWSNIIAQNIKVTTPISIVQNGFIFFNKIIKEGYVGLGCAYASQKSDSMSNNSVSDNIIMIPIQNNDLFYNCMIHSSEQELTPVIQAFQDFIKEKFTNNETELS